MVEWLLHTVEDNSEALEDLHRRAITEARVRGLDYKAMAAEFNEKKLRRGNNYRQPWTAKYIILRWSKLKRLQRKREQKGSAKVAVSKPCHSEGVSMNTNPVRNSSKAQSSTPAFLPRSRGSRCKGTPRQAPVVVTITFAIRWRNEPGHTVYKTSPFGGEEPASSDKGYRKHN